MKSRTLGQKVKLFRNLKGISQFALELEIGLATGSLSRIENNAINPTKETLFKIASSLSLNPFEIMYLLDIHSKEPSMEEIKHILSLVKPSLDKTWIFAYLLDNDSRIIEFSNGFYYLSKLANLNITAWKGVHIVDLYFNPKYGLRGIINKDKFEITAKHVIATLIYEKHYQVDQDDLNTFMELPDFRGFYREVAENPLSLNDQANRVLSMRILNKNIELYYTRTYIHADPRFTLIDYKVNGTDSALKGLMNNV